MLSLVIPVSQETFFICVGCDQVFVNADVLFYEAVILGHDEAGVDLVFN